MMGFASSGRMRKLSRLLIDGMRNENAFIVKQRLYIRKSTLPMRPMLILMKSSIIMFSQNV